MIEKRLTAVVKPNPLNPRGPIVSDQGIQELADSIKVNGLLYPLIITPENVVIAGHRRLRACEIAGVLEVAVTVKDLPEIEQLQILLVENLQRQDLSPLQTARAYKRLVDEGLSIGDIVQRIGVHRDSVSRTLKILKLPESLYKYFDSFELPLLSLPLLLALPSVDKQTAIATAAAEERWTVSEIEAACKRIMEPKAARQSVAKSLDGAYIFKVEKAIRSLYDITDSLEEIDDMNLRPALFKLGDGIQELEKVVKVKRNSQGSNTRAEVTKGEG